MFIVSGLYTTEEEPRILLYPWPFGLHIINYFPGCWRERAASWFIFKRIVTPQNDQTVVGKLVCETVHHSEVLSLSFSNKHSSAFQGNKIFVLYLF